MRTWRGSNYRGILGDSVGGETHKILLRKDGTKRIDDNALAALTLMVAASKPSEKDKLIKVILNLMH